jgi:predicted dehydrogenase
MIMNESIPRRDFLSTLSGSLAALAASAGPCIAGAGNTRASRPRIRAGQIGTAHAHAAGKMAAMRKLAEDYEVVGVVEPDAERRAAAEKNPTYQGLKWMAEEALLGIEGLQMVAVETAVRDLVPTAARVVAAGRHVHLDKPAGESLSAFKRLLDEATRRRLTVQMGYMLRYNPAFQLCFQAVREGWLGQVISVDAAMSKLIDGRSRAALRPYRGGAMFELGCHLIDAVISVLGRPQRVTAFSRSASPQNDGFADNQLAVLEYPRVTATVRSAVVEFAGERRRHFVVCGDRGSVQIQPLEPPQVRLALSEARGGYPKGTQELAMPRLARYDGEFTDLAKVIRGEKDFGFPPEHDLAVHETILRASGLPVE